MDFGKINPLYSPFLYAVGKNVQGMAFDLLWRRKVRGIENIPPFGTPVIFAANHRSLADPPLVGSAIPYPIFYFAKEELFHVPLLGWCIRRVNAFPVRRHDHDVAAFKTAHRVLEGGGGLMLFPEGGRRLDPKRQWKAKAGVGMLACKTGAYVVPVGIKNSDRFVQFASLEVSFGKPFRPVLGANREDYQNLADQIIDKIKELIT